MVIRPFSHRKQWFDRPQLDSWRGLLRGLLRAVDRARQRAALRALADNKHLLDDIGLSRRQVIDEADRPFWQ